MITEPQDAADFVYNLLKTQAGPLGIGFVGYADKLNPNYPAVVVTPGRKAKSLHATHTFNVAIEIDIMVYHARLSTDHKTRTREDLALVTSIENTLEQGDMNFGGQVIFAFVRETYPGTITRPKGEQVVGTRMLVDVLSQKRFPYVP